jgi:DNA repair protein RecO (recombination protein O)
MDYKYTGIILAKRDVGEADRIYTFYTLESGKIQAKATSVRKPQAKLASSLENFILADITVVKKQGMGRITSSIVENNFSQMRSNLDALAAVFEAVDIFNRLINLEEKDEKTFQLLLEFLESLDLPDVSSEKAEILKLGFVFKLLDILGYKVEASVCAVCGVKLAGSENYFSAEQGGVVCHKCKADGRGFLKISANSVKVVRIFFTNSLKSLMKLKVGAAEIRELEIVLKTFNNWIAK